jgi:hypothetical protein
MLALYVKLSFFAATLTSVPAFPTLIPLKKPNHTKGASMKVKTKVKAGANGNWSDYYD